LPGGEKMLKIKDSFLILTVFILLLSLGFSTGITSAAFKTPNFLTPYIPAGFVIDEKQCSSQNVGMFNSINIFARKVNQLPKPFVSPEFSYFELGYAETTNAAYVQPMWEEAQQKAEEESKTQTNPQNTFIGKETIKGGGSIYWYQGVAFNAQGAKDEAGQLNIYAATIIKQVGKGVLTIKLTGFVGERDVIRKCF
jgi:hypothetical protein